jgi:5-methylcytosine-specific restriction endonuclease McrA
MTKLSKPRLWSREAHRDRLYGRKWKAARQAYLAAHPLCVYCEQLGRVTAASVVDHITPHRGDEKLFWDATNWQPLCEACHNGAKAELEQTGTLRGCDTSGTPLDPGHPWNFFR